VPGRGSCTEHVDKLRDAGETETKGDFLLKLNSDSIRPRPGTALARQSNLKVNITSIRLQSFLIDRRRRRSAIIEE
jgi:hypothetical protein